eukprot:gnl/TRDRNA2_/TRDRNA2_185648_c0_seq1.p1 gnl/TRDRNA2_/TRDRNA2_185648_c0~~gnl/TRDRNA2_/TRDRNA2_185648_c0_seq1.p1  ORF type:complete len:218 (+),score=28.73 gnl/TRDRNA2_/TRDRNA2_185648_c0_seq1:71-655(+)
MLSVALLLLSANGATSHSTPEPGACSAVEESCDTADEVTLLQLKTDPMIQARGDPPGFSVAAYPGQLQASDPSATPALVAAPQAMTVRDIGSAVGNAAVAVGQSLAASSEHHPSPSPPAGAASGAASDDGGDRGKKMERLHAVEEIADLGAIALASVAWTVGSIEHIMTDISIRLTATSLLAKALTKGVGEEEH